MTSINFISEDQTDICLPVGKLTINYITLARIADIVLTNDRGQYIRAKRRLAYARNAFDKKMTASEDRYESQVNDVVLAANDLLERAFQ